MKPAWYRSLWFLLLSCLIFPPLGFVLLWMYPTRVYRKIFGSLFLFGFSIFHLVKFYGMRVELAGSGMRPIVSFYNPESHYAALERSRANPPATPAPAPEPAAKAAEKSATPAAPSAPAFWTDFRGPRRDGVYDQMPLLARWPEKGLTQLWKQPSGGGYASFVVARGKAYTIEQRRKQEVVAAYDAATGRELWTHAWDADFQEPLGGPGPRATPTWHDGRIYALGAIGEFRCLDAETGKRIWSHNILTENGATNLIWGMSNSPLIVDDNVVVQPGGPAGKSIVAYNKLTGERAWSVLDDKAGYTSPMLVTLAGERQILAVSGTRILGLGPADGKLLWDYPWYTSPEVNSAQPILLGDDRFFVSAGYGHGSIVLAIEKAATGFSARKIWENNKMKNRFNSSVLYKGFIYGLDEGIFACIDAATGELKWKGGRYGYGQILLAGSNIIVLTESGELVLVAANPEKLEELAKFTAIEGKTWNYPAIAEGRLLVRNELEMAAYRIAP